MKIETIVVGMFQCNCRIISSDTSNEAIVIDPGDEASEILQYLQGKNLKVKAIIHTHAHLDHVMATSAVQAKTQAPVWLHKEDLFLYENLAMQGAMFGIQVPPVTPITHWIEDEMNISTTDFKLRALHTPGHTPGSCCFHYEGAESIVFTGDTLFEESIGRTDLWGGDFGQIKKSIKERLYTLDDDTIVLSGHGSPTKIGHEKRYNAFVTA